MKFELLKKDSNSSARLGKITTDHGAFETPIFMPVATSAAIKGLHGKDLIESSDPQIILANTYQLYLRPGDEFAGVRVQAKPNSLTNSNRRKRWALCRTRPVAMSERPRRPIHTAEKPDPMMLSNWRVRSWAVRVPMAAAVAKSPNPGKPRTRSGFF